MELLEQRKKERATGVKETPTVAIEDQTPIDMPDILRREDVSVTGKRKRTKGTSKKKAIMH